LVLKWIAGAGEVPQGVDLNHLLLLKARFEFAYGLLRALRVPLNEGTPMVPLLKDGAIHPDLIAWAMINAWKESGAEALLSQLAEMFENEEMGNQSDNISAVWFGLKDQ
jgi:hypothetical protein